MLGSVEAAMTLTFRPDSALMRRNLQLSFMNGTQIELKPLPYHEQLRDYLRSHEKELWDWFASAQAKADYAEHLRIELLKTTYRLDPKIHAELYRALDEAKASLNLDIPVTLYQAQQSQNLNASLLHLPG